MRWMKPGLYLSIILSSVIGVPLESARSDGALPEDRGAAGLWRVLLELQTTASILHITAHPDDEDGAMLTMLARGQGVRTALLSLSRGEGGANLIAPFFFDELGVLRTLELLESTRYYGVELFFTRAVDYGYSKSVDEARSHWADSEHVLRDTVRVIRRERPDVIIARFRGDARDGHGHHTFSGLIAQQAFEAAADPNRFPEQVAEGLRPWSVKKLYHNNIRPSRRPEDKDAWTLIARTGEFNPLLGRSYAQIARHGLGYQRSQGISGHGSPGGPRPSYYRRADRSLATHAGDREQSFFDGLDTGLTDIAALAGPRPPEWLVSGLRPIDEAVHAAVKAFAPMNPEQTATPLAAGLRTTRALARQVSESTLDEAARDQTSFLLRHKERQFQRALALALGTDLQVTAKGDASSTVAGFSHATPGQRVTAEIRLVNRSPIPIRPVRVRIAAPADWAVTGETAGTEPLSYNKVWSRTFDVQIPVDAAVTRPHWHRDSIRESLYTVDDPTHHTRPFPPPPVWGVARLEAFETWFELRAPVRVLIRHPKFGAIRPALTVVPPISVQFARKNGVLPIGRRTYVVSVRVRSSAKNPAQGTLRLRLPDGWESEPVLTSFVLAREDEEASFDFTVGVPGRLAERAYTIEAVATYVGREYDEGFETISARDLDRFNMYRPAKHQVRAVDLKIAPNLRLAYIMGSGDDVPQAIEPLGVTIDQLGPTELGKTDLSRYDAVLVGVRAYAVRPDLVTHNGRLLSYVKEGGVLVVQYQTPEFDHNFGPYPYTMGRRPEEVSEEDAVVTLLDSANPVFVAPNRITPRDFDDWVEERGSKFWTAWDERYQPLLVCHDRDQAPQKGGMLYARYGKGVYIYSAYAWYRQLPHGVPGAFRIYANLISLHRTLNNRS